MEKYLTFDDGKSRKFWQVRTEGAKAIVTFGKIGTTGQAPQEKTYPSPEEAEKDAAKQAAAKVKKGYVEGNVPAHSSDSNLKLLFTYEAKNFTFDGCKNSDGDYFEKEEMNGILKKLFIEYPKFFTNPSGETVVGFTDSAETIVDNNDGSDGHILNVRILKGGLNVDGASFSIEDDGLGLCGWVYAFIEVTCDEEIDEDIISGMIDDIVAGMAISVECGGYIFETGNYGKVDVNVCLDRKAWKSCGFTAKYTPEMKEMLADL